MKISMFVATIILASHAIAMSPTEQLGHIIFNDDRLSQPVGQACASCHSAGAAFTDPMGMASSRGANQSSFGNRNAPTIGYMKFAKPLAAKTEDGETSYEGGLFWDGRANTLEEQAKGPFVNPIEMGSTKEYVAKAVCTSDQYGALFRSVFGESICDVMISFGLPPGLKIVDQVQKIFDSVASALGTYERTAEFAPFTSKFDRVNAGLDKYTDTEMRGYNLFVDEKTANCIGCHVLEKDNDAGRPLFTDFSYDNLGVPTNLEIRAAGYSDSDLGLAKVSGRDEDKGRFKVPTLRNIAQTAPYMHNGYFKTLEQVVDFYNTRDTKPACATLMSAEDAEANSCWPVAEVPETVNHKELGNLKLSNQDVQDLVAFMQTLSD